MKKNILFSITLLMTFAMLFSFTSCGGSDGSDGGGNGGSGGGGWYAERFYTSFPVTTAGYGIYKDYVLAHIDELFGYDGRYGGVIKLPDGRETHGPAYQWDEITVAHLANNIIELYDACLYKVGSSGTSGKTLIYKVSGSPLGEVGYYASSPSYTTSYTQEGNVITTNVNNKKETITITSDGLLVDGSKWIKFNLGQTYTDSYNDDAETSAAMSLARNMSKTASVVGNPTFHQATFQCSFGSINNNTNISIHKVFAFSKNRSDLENVSELTSRYYQARNQGRIEPSAYVSALNQTYINNYDNYYYEDGNLRFAEEGTANLDNFTAVYDEFNVTIYYCPLVTVANTGFAGEIKSVSLRQLKETSGFVDLGLSCRWSATNNKASSPWDFGRDITLLNQNISGDGRLPTKAEVLELNNCTLETIDNGVLVTGKNGNQIFIPFCDTKGQSIYPGYGTSSTQTSGSSKYDVLFGFDSSTKKFTTKSASSPYNIGSYTMHTTAYVRPVLDGSGGSGEGGGNDGSGINLVLKDMLRCPFGFIDDINFQSDSFSSILNRLQQFSYKMLAGDNYIYIFASENWEIFNAYRYKGLPFNELSIFDHNKVGSKTINYSFAISKLEAPDPYYYSNSIVNDFKELGAPLEITNYENTGADGEMIVYGSWSNGKTMYYTTLTSYPSFWYFVVSVKYE